MAGSNGHTPLERGNTRPLLPAPAKTTIRGTVKWFDPVKGYGFIVPGTPNGPDVFVHYTNIVGKGYRTLEEGQDVEFVLEKGPKGPFASEVRVLHSRWGYFDPL